MTGSIGPVRLEPNQPRHFYRGGGSIAGLRGLPVTTEFGPEDWVGSTTTRFGHDLAGLSSLPDGTLLRDAVAADPVSWLGTEHVAAFGSDTALLVKLLDPAQRLPVHCHPDNSFAAKHFGCRHGKTEAWIVVGTSGRGSAVHIGFRQDVDAATVEQWVRGQDRTAMLGALNTIPVAPGDAVFVPAGLPHAIDGGVFLVELQQPTDFSITLEWRGFLDDPDSWHLGLGGEVALRCVDRSGWSVDRLSSLIRHTADRRTGVVELIGNTDFFRADRLHTDSPVEMDPSFAVLVVLEGTGRLRAEHGGTTELRKGDTLVLPHSAGQATVDGGAVAVRCRPPAPKGGT
ncbi:MAG: mannose-6-phosphate isomerase [Kutzneria sp.]|nr:mannose-6-phosphate isomerase [Kutzneria sp.]